MTELLFIRHGETDCNRQQRFQGQLDAPLNALGHRQAARLAQRLAAERCELLLTSDLQRARETAAPLAQSWALPALAQPGWREQGFGLFEGLDVSTIRSRHPELWRQWIDQRDDFALPGGESLREFHARVLAAMHELVTTAAGRRVAVVTHGGVLDMLWRTAHGLPLGGHRRCEIPNTGINRLRFAGGSLRVEVWADDAHLADLPAQPDMTPARA